MAGGEAADNRALPPEDEAARVRQVWVSALEEKQTWCVLDAKWFKVWCNYSGFDPNQKQSPDGKYAPGSGSRPGPINNRALHTENEFELKKGLMEEDDFVLVHQPVWQLLHGWYGGGPEFAREVIAVGLKREARVDFFPLFLRTVELGSDGEPDEKTARLRRFAKQSTFAQYISSLERQRDLKPGSVRLWIKLESKTTSPERGSVEGVAPAAADAAVPADPPPKVKWAPVRGQQLEQALETFLFPANATVWIEQKASDGEWVRSAVKKNFRDFEVGDVVDAEDTVHKWYESEVREVKTEERKVFIHFIGWPHKWDEWMDFESSRIAMQNSHTTGPLVPRQESRSSTSDLYGSSYSSNEPGQPLQRGAVGLRNLGNTCFMNSTLQCLSNTPLLTEYFLDEKYIPELNRDNPLGWKGRIAEEYGALLKELWSGKFRVVAPSKLKYAIGEYAPRFSGYQQQDSSELLSFLLDGLHEDLNRVLKKPATTTVESNGRPDAEVAREAWDMYQKRNQSVVVDTLQGQLKSKLVCPTCNRVSITFDPFMFLSVPLPQNQDRVVSVTVAFADPQKPLLTIGCRVPKISNVIELKSAMSKIVDVPARRFVIGDLYNAKISRLLLDDESVRDIRKSDQVFAYEVPDLDELPLGRAAPFFVIHVSDTATPGRQPAYFGLPLVFLLPKAEDYSNGELRAKVDEQCKRFILPGFQGNPYRVYVDETELIAGSQERVRFGYYNYRREIVVQWLENAAAYDDNKIKIEEHETAQAAAGAGEGVGSAEATLTVGDCVEAFTREEILGQEDAWYCSTCKDHVRATKKFDIYRLPDILVMHLKRFSYSRISRDKIGTYVDFPVEALDMSRFCVNPEEKQDAVYDLYAISNHMGGLGGGHYTAFCKNLVDGRWYLHDDSLIRPVERVEDIKSSAAYVLFYVRRRAQAKGHMNSRSFDGVPAVVKAPKMVIE